MEHMRVILDWTWERLSPAEFRPNCGCGYVVGVRPPADHRKKDPRISVIKCANGHLSALRYLSLILPVWSITLTLLTLPTVPIMSMGTKLER